MRIVLLGSPGVGKGTQARLVSLRKKIPAIATGDMLRFAIESGSGLGDRAAEFVRKGELVPDDVMIGVVQERLDQPDAGDGFLLDGFPRTVAQAEALDAIMKRQGRKLDTVISLSAPESLIVERIGGRLTCSNCGAIFHDKLNPPVTFGTCDVCQGRLMVREDDQPDAVRRRLAIYHDRSASLVDYYRTRSLLREVDAGGDVEAVYSHIEAALEA